MIPWLKPKADNELKISFLNIQSLKAHYFDLKNDHRILLSDIICLTETWLSDDSEDTCWTIPGYNLYHSSFGKGKGVAVYLRDSLEAQNKQQSSRKSLQWIKVTVQQLDILVLYRPPKGCQADDLKTQMTPLVATKNRCLVVGKYLFSVTLRF